jgi:spermidine synthase/MFS family permease
MMQRMSQSTRRILFFLFFLSGFSSLAYQVVWTRMAFATFGIITPVLSVVLSVFMLGLAVGSWAGGRWISLLARRTGLSAIAFYALAEFFIGLGAFAVPRLFTLGGHVLLAAGQTDSLPYLSLSALVLAAAVLPWCVCMGTTFPFMMAYIQERDRGNRESFSFLYLANVLGAMSGTFLTALILVELLGFRHTLWLAAAGNFTIVAIGAWLARKPQVSPGAAASAAENSTAPAAASPPVAPRLRLVKWILFSTGFIAMAMEVVWTRAFTPVLKTQVYSFAAIVFTYLGATFIGSWMYRRDLQKQSLRSRAELMAWLALGALLPIVANDPRWVAMDSTSLIQLDSVITLLASICLFCAVLGYLTPGLIDEYGAGQPKKAGRAYAINVLGCILGPLFASYLLLPAMSERSVLLVLGLPLLIFYLLHARWLPTLARWKSGLAVGLVLVWVLFFARDSRDWVANFSPSVSVRRDYAASVTAMGEGMNKCLLVNGIGMTKLTPITKFMVHLPLAFRPNPPQSALILCFGMGTTYRSALSWGIDTTAVELVPSVTKMFGFYHADAAQALQNPKGRIIIDDGRRYLKRTREQFDVIVIDPPPPVETAGCSLLYSDEFYALARQRLKPHGILTTWIPAAETLTVQAIVRSVHESFPYVRCFVSVEGWGAHLLASMDPIGPCTPEQLAARMPAGAKRDLLEWSATPDLPAYLDLVTSHELDLKEVLNPNPDIRITDDEPYNEYFLLRQAGLGWR